MYRLSSNGRAAIAKNAEEAVKALSIITQMIDEDTYDLIKDHLDDLLASLEEMKVGRFYLFGRVVVEKIAE